MTHSGEKERWRDRGLPGRLYHWAKDEHAVGLDVHDGQIVAAHFVEHGGELLLNALATETIDPALSEKELAHCIRSFWKKHKLPTRTVCTCLHTPSLIARSFSYSNVLFDELPHVLSLEAEEALQLPLEQIALSWHLNPEKKSSEISGALVAAPRKTVSDHIRLMQASGLYPVNVEIGCSAVINLYDFLAGGADHSTVCLVNLTAHMAEIVILSAGAAYPRIVFSSNEAGWQNNLEYLVANIESALLHYHLKIKGDPVTKLLLSGSAQQSRLRDRIDEAVSVPVEYWSLRGEEKTAPFFESKQSPKETAEANLATGLGLGLRRPKKER